VVIWYIFSPFWYSIPRIIWQPRTHKKVSPTKLLGSRFFQDGAVPMQEKNAESSFVVSAILLPHSTYILPTYICTFWCDINLLSKWNAKFSNCVSAVLYLNTFLHIQAVMPDGIFSNQKSQFG
jgi:hypothetical protein